MATRTIESVEHSVPGTSTERSLPPEVARDLILNGLDRPTIFRNTIDHWSCRSWNLYDWAEIWGAKRLKFRVGPIHDNNSDGPLWEADCDYVEATLADFVEWQTDHTSNNRNLNPENILAEVDPSRFWIYADYKHLGQIFKLDHDIHKVGHHDVNSIDWGPLGFIGRRGEASTVWIGSALAQTPCHYDTYGFNLVAQIIGRKRWILFAPADTRNLYPTRIPYEESSVFSRVDVTNPDLKKFPKFQLSVPYIVTLEPGDVLFVPHKWWHFVTSIDTSISVNSWIETGTDDECRLEEAVTRSIISSLMDTYPLMSVEWLNPTEKEVLPAVNLHYVWESLDRCLKSMPTTSSCAQKGELVQEESCKVNAVPRAKKPRNEECQELRKRYDSVITMVTPSTFNSLMEEAAFKKQTNAIKINETTEDTITLSSSSSTPANMASSSTVLKEDRLRSNLINAILDPEVISLICEKFKQSILLKNQD